VGGQVRSEPAVEAVELVPFKRHGGGDLGSML
jgi:hypothetical protein